MSKLFASFLALAVSFSGVSALPDSGELLESRGTTSNFSLYAYGSNNETEIGGFPVFYYEGLAYLANPVEFNYTDGFVVFNTNSTELIADSLTASTSTWSDSLFYIPSGYGSVGFYKDGLSNVSLSDIITTGFKFYGATAMVNVDGTLETLWYAVQTETAGLWSVSWNATGAGIDDAELLTLRKVAAPNLDYSST